MEGVWGFGSLDIFIGNSYAGVIKVELRWIWDPFATAHAVVSYRDARGRLLVTSIAHKGHLSIASTQQ